MKLISKNSHMNTELFLFWLLDVKNNIMFPTCKNIQKWVKNQKSTDRHLPFNGLIQEYIDLSDIYLAAETISTKGAGFAHHITTRPFGFSDWLLQYYVKDSDYVYLLQVIALLKLRQTKILGFNLFKTM